MSASGSQPVDLSTPKKSSDITSSVSVPRLPPAPGSKRSGSSSIFGAPNSRIQSFDSFNAAGQPVLDLHSALNGIQKSFTIGKILKLHHFLRNTLHYIIRYISSCFLGSGNQSRPGQQQQLLPPPPLMRNSCIGRNGVSSNGGNSRSSSSGSNLSPSPPPCPAPNNMHLWASLAAASSFGKSLEQNFAAFNIPTRNFTPPQYLGYPGCPGNEGVPTKSMRISSGKEFTIGDLSVHDK